MHYPSTTLFFESCASLLKHGDLLATFAGDKTGKYTGVLQCFVKTAREEGLGAFYKGFIPNFGRLGSWNVVMFLTLEQASAAACPLPACPHCFNCFYCCYRFYHQVCWSLVGLGHRNILTLEEASVTLATRLSPLSQSLLLLLR